MYRRSKPPYKSVVSYDLMIYGEVLSGQEQAFESKIKFIGGSMLKLWLE